MSSGPLRILGIDPGLQTAGFGVIDMQGPHLAYVASGTIRTDVRQSLPERLKVLYEGVREVVARYQPDACSVEIVFVNNNPQATLLLGQARGCCVTALVSAGQNVHEYTALQLKKAVAGSGRAGKAEVQEMVMRLLGLPGLPGKDAADALGLAITHAHVGTAMDRLRQASLQPGAVVGGNPEAILAGRYRSGRSR